MCQQAGTQNHDAEGLYQHLTSHVQCWHSFWDFFGTLLNDISDVCAAFTACMVLTISHSCRQSDYVLVLPAFLWPDLALQQLGIGYKAGAQCVLS